MIRQVLWTEAIELLPCRSDFGEGWEVGSGRRTSQKQVQSTVDSRHISISPSSADY